MDGLAFLLFLERRLNPVINITRFLLRLIKTKSDDPSVIEKQSEVKIKPSNNENILRMKQDVATKIKKHRGKEWSYWYLVAEIETPSGTKAYRTVIGKTFF